jgi:hypothetical protein
VRTAPSATAAGWLAQVHCVDAEERKSSALSLWYSGRFFSKAVQWGHAHCVGLRPTRHGHPHRVIHFSLPAWRTTEPSFFL